MCGPLSSHSTSALPSPAVRTVAVSLHDVSCAITRSAASSEVEPHTASTKSCAQVCRSRWASHEEHVRKIRASATPLTVEQKIAIRDVFLKYLLEREARRNNARTGGTTI